MRRRLVALLLLLLAASPADAQQLFINFDNCSATAPSKTRFLDCSDPNAYSSIITSVDVGSSPLSGVIADLGVIDLLAGYFQEPVMPAFWQFNQSGCGAGNWRFASDFAGGPFECLDLWQGLAEGAGQYGGTTGPNPDGNRARVKYTWAVYPEQAFEVPASTETYVCRMTVRQQHLSACPEGCDLPVCVVYVEEQLAVLAGGAFVIQNPDYVIFNSYIDLLNRNRQVNCTGASPSRPRTWGSVKTLYR